MPTSNEPNELQQLAPRLNAMRKCDPFKTPEGYFEQLPHAVQARIAAHTSRSIQRPSLRWAWAVPGLLLMVGLGWWAWSDTPASATALVDIPVLEDAELDLLNPPNAFSSTEQVVVAWDLPTIVLTDDELITYLEQESIDLLAVLENP